MASHPPAAAVYRPRRPTEIPLYPGVQHHIETFLTEAHEADPMEGGVPSWVERDFRGYLRCGILAYGFALRSRCERPASSTDRPQRGSAGLPRYRHDSKLQFNPCDSSGPELRGV